MPTFDSDRPMNVLGVDGRLTHRTTRPDRPDRFFMQRWISEARRAPAYDSPGRQGFIRAEMRFDDELNNGQPSFAITADIFSVAGRGNNRFEAGGCCHGDIARAFPELAPLVQWHLADMRGPMHGVANALYLAGDADYNGLRKGEQKPLLARDGIPHWELTVLGIPAELIRYDGDTPGSDQPLYRLVTSHKGAAPPPLPVIGWRQKMITGEGKARELDAARRAANWPDATDEELCLPRAELKAKLEARLPDLITRFREAMISIGFYLSPADAEAAGITPEGN